MEVQPLFQSLSLVENPSLKPPPPLKGINRLDEHTLLELFNRFPLRDLIRIGRVSRLWARTRAKACLTRKQMFLQFDGQKIIYNFSSIYLRKIPANFGQVVNRSLLPNITSLNIFFMATQIDIDWLLALVGNEWADQLTVLSLLDIDHDHHEETAGLEVTQRQMANSKLLQLLSSLNSGQFASLKQLTFFSSGNYIFPENYDHSVGGALHLPIVSQLELFKFKSLDNLDFLISALEKYPLPTSRRIELDNTFDDLETMTKLCSIDENVAAQFRMISLCHYFELDSAEMRSFGSRFTSLVRLDLPLIEFTLSQLVRALHPLAQLQELFVYFDLEVLKEIDEESDDDEEEEVVVNLEDYALASVGYLSLKICTMTKHADFGLLYLDKWLPNLTEMDFRHACTACSLGYDDKSVYKRAQCRRMLLRQPFWANFARLDPSNVKVIRN